MYIYIFFFLLEIYIFYLLKLSCVFGADENATLLVLMWDLHRATDFQKKKNNIVWLNNKFYQSYFDRNIKKTKS